MTRTRTAALVLEVLGGASVTVGAFLVAAWLGFVVLGVLGILFGLALER